MKQQNLFKYFKNTNLTKAAGAKPYNFKCLNEFGGALSVRGKRKTRRPLDVKKPIHLVLRADTSKSGSFLKRKNSIDLLICKYAKKFQIKVYRSAIVSNHLHFVIKFSHRFNYQCFIRALTGALAKIHNIKWQFLPFTRIVSWGRDFVTVMNYVLQNTIEAHGVIPYQPRQFPKKLRLNSG